jgi:hypothetical protein
VRKYFILLLLSGVSFAENYIPGANIYSFLNRGLTWASTINQTWVIDAVSPATGVCLTIQNNDTSSHNFTLASYVTSDQSLKVLGTAVKWQQVALSPPATSGGFTVLASSVLQIYAKTTSAYHIAFQFSGGSGTGTVDLYYSQTGTPCGSVNQWTTVGTTSGQLVLTFAAVSGVKHVLNCIDASLEGGASAATNPQVFIRDNDVSGNCTGGAVIYIHGMAFPLTTPTGQYVALCGLNIPSGLGHSLTMCTGAAITGVIQNGFMSGYDSQ